MAERPIIFSAPMVRAILAGRKTQTRRVLKPQPPTAPDWHVADRDEDQVLWMGDRGTHVQARIRFAIGDLLWVRESWRTELRNDDITPRDLRHGVPVYYEAGGGGEETIPECAGRLRPSIHMPRWASRITLKVTGVKVERLQDISEEDAEAEGADPFTGALQSYRTSFYNIWERIHGPGSWDANPWVAAISFERVANPETGGGER